MHRSKRIVAASGYFNPLHKGHIEYLQRSRALGDQLVVIINNDHQTMLKKGTVLIPAADRLEVIRALACVDFALISCDQDRTVCQTLRYLRPHIFTNGGDQTNANIPEAALCAKLGIQLIDGLGDKIESSSAIVERAQLTQ